MDKIFQIANSRPLNLFFPLADFLYIFQLEEYNTEYFLKWSIKRLFKRNFQKIGEITWTDKAKAIYIVSLIVILIFSLFATFLVSFHLKLLIFVAIIIISSFLTPLWLIIATFVIFPLEYYLKNKAVNLAKGKLSSLDNLQIVAIAGSVGKTSTRHFLTNLLDDKKVFTTQGNYNTMLGIASEINDKLTADKKIFIVELGEYFPGDLVKLASFLKPSILILTKIGSQHIEKFGNQANLNSEFINLCKYPSVKIIYSDSENILAKSLKHESHVKLIMTKAYQNYFTPLENPQIAQSASLMENLSVAIAAAEGLGVKRDEIIKRLTRLTPLERRLTIKSENGITFIDDSYNISFESAKNAVDFLGKQKGRKIIITGGIVEQGKMSEAVNRNYGKLISKCADVVIVAKNIFYKWIKEEIESKNTQAKVIVSDNPSKTPQILRRILKKGDVLLIQNELPEIYWH